MKNLSYMDSHAHLGDHAVFDQVEALLERADAANVKSIINICTDVLTLERGLDLAARYPWIYCAAATTPHDVEKEGDLVFEIIAEKARQGFLKAIGETGLDYHYQHSSPSIQQKFLRKYLKLALECHLPVVIHCREAFADFFQILDEEYRVQDQWAPGVLHCFTGTVAEAEEVIKRGWMLSLSGIVTFKKSFELHEVAKNIPLNQLLIETDTPYLAPHPYRGKMNEPAFVVETAKFIANLRHISLEQVAKATFQNGQSLFKI